MRTAEAMSCLKLLTASTLLQLAVACGGSISDPDPFPPGMLAIELQPAASVKFKEVKYDLTRRDNFSRSGPVAVSLDDKQVNFGFTVDDLQPADYYLLTINADASVVGENRSTTCRGRTSFAIEAGKTTSVAVRVQCSGVANTGTMMTAKVNECPMVMSLKASPSRAAIGERVALQADVRDDMVGPRPLSYSWSTNGGAFAGSKDQTSFECTREGLVKVNLLVSDGDTTCKENTASVSVTCTDDSAPAAGSGVAGASGVPAALAGLAAGMGGVGGVSRGTAGSGGSRSTQTRATAGRGATTSSPVQTQVSRVVGGAGAPAPKVQTGSAGTPGSTAGVVSVHPAAVGGSSGSTSVSITVLAGGAGAGAAAGSGSMEPEAEGDASEEGGSGGEEHEPRRGERRRRQGMPDQGTAGAAESGSDATTGEGGAGGSASTVVTITVPAEVAGSGGAP